MPLFRSRQRQRGALLPNTLRDRAERRPEGRQLTNRDAWRAGSGSDVSLAQVLVMSLFALLGLAALAFAAALMAVALACGSGLGLSLAILASEHYEEGRGWTTPELAVFVGATATGALATAATWPLGRWVGSRLSPGALRVVRRAVRPSRDAMWPEMKVPFLRVLVGAAVAGAVALAAGLAIEA